MRENIKILWNGFAGYDGLQEIGKTTFSNFIEGASGYGPQMRDISLVLHFLTILKVPERSNKVEHCTFLCLRAA